MSNHINRDSWQQAATILENLWSAQEEKAATSTTGRAIESRFLLASELRAIVETARRRYADELYQPIEVVDEKSYDQCLQKLDQAKNEAICLASECPAAQALKLRGSQFSFILIYINFNTLSVL